METTLDAILAKNTDAETHLGNIETAVQLIDNGYGAMTTQTLMNASIAESSAEGVSSTITKLREIEHIGFVVVAATNASYSAFIEYSVDNTTFIQSGDLSIGELASVGNIYQAGLQGFRYFRLRVINNHNEAQTFVVKASY